MIIHNSQTPPSGAHTKRRILKDIVVYKNCASDATANVLALHGLHGSTEQYNHFLARLRKANLNVYAYDAPNHGRSLQNEGERSLIYSFDKLVLTTWAVMEHIVESDDFNGRPFILFGHSMGALEVVRLLQNRAFMHKYGNLIAGAICASMVFRVDHNIPSYQRIVLRPALKWFHKKKSRREIMAKHSMSRPEQIVKKMHAIARKQIDPSGKEVVPDESEERGGYTQMVEEVGEAEQRGDRKAAEQKREVTWLTGYEINEAVHKANAQVERLRRVPIIFPHGLNDIEAPLVAVQKAIDRMRHGLVLYYADRGHHLFTDTESGKPRGNEHRDAIRWIKIQIQKWEQGLSPIPYADNAEARTEAVRGQFWNVLEELRVLGKLSLKKLRRKSGAD